MPTIQDHLQQIPDLLQQADEQTLERNHHAIGFLIIALDNLTAAVTQINARLQQLERDYDHQRN